MNKKVLFCGLSVSAQSWYRCGLPALALEQDWLGMVNGPPGQGIVTGGNVELIQKITDYHIVVVQMGKGKEWESFIKQAQKEGVKFLYEVDDFIHGVRKVKNHSSSDGFHKKAVKEYQAVMEICDGMICSTDFLSSQYKKYNENQFVVKNAIDAWRYETREPEKEKVVVGWSGGTGHDISIVPALRAVNRLMELRHDVIFVTAGIPYADVIGANHPGRTKSIPWTGLENYPYVLSYFDVSLAPGHESKYHLSKSDLRWLEASASDTAFVGDRRIYQEVEEGKTGIFAQTEEEYLEAMIYLVENEQARRQIASEAKKYVWENRNIENQSGNWQEVFNRI